jgi:hypothetical protein
VAIREKINTYVLENRISRQLRPETLTLKNWVALITVFNARTDLSHFCKS